MTNPIRLLELSLVMALSSAAAAQTTFEPNTDRRTGAERVVTVAPWRGLQGCLDVCLNDRACRSWTFVDHRDGLAECSLGGQERPPRIESSCCTSGTR
jgi:hypothetical protein